MTEIREEGLTPRKVPRKIKEKLLFANVITEEHLTKGKSNSLLYKQTKSVNNRKTVKTVMTLIQ
jgi:hypothetical protein